MSCDSNHQYPQKWKRLSAALSELMTAGFPETVAKRIICNGIADSEFKIQLGLRRHATRHLTAHGKRLSGDDVEVPARLEPEEFDFDESRPLRPWTVKREKIPHLVGPWIIDWLEVYGPDIAKLTNAVVKREGSPLRRRKTPTARERAQRVILALYPNGIPDQVTEPNARLCQRVAAELKKLGLLNVSDDSILRAAGRRK